MSETRLIFLHLPKTGGSTFHGILVRQYKASDLYHVRTHADAQRFSRESEAVRSRIKVLKGHMGFGFHTDFPGKDPVKYVTLMREPVARTISHYSFIRERSYHKLHKVVVENDYSLKDYVTKGLREDTDNPQLRLLSGDVKIPFGTCSSEMVQKAKDHINDHFLLAGTLEYYHEFLLMLQDELGWKTPYYNRENVTGRKIRREEVDQDTIDVIRETHRYEIELYDWVKARFEAKLGNQPDEFAQRVARFTKRNKKVEQLARIKNAIWPARRRSYGSA